MVRLFMPQGAGLHPAIIKHDEPNCANWLTPIVTISPVISVFLLLGRTLLRRPLLSLPTNTAYFLTRTGAATFAITPVIAYASHFDRQINSSILRYEGISPPKYKLWQNSQGFTADDAMLIGGIGGLLLSFRLGGLQSLSIGRRLLGRLGAVSTGMSAGIASSYKLMDTNIERPSMQRSHYEQAVALRKLNNDPKFNESLSLGPQLAERIWRRTVIAEQKAMSFASLTPEEKTALHPTMVFSWLDVASYNFLNNNINEASLPVKWNFPEDASPAEKRDYILKEVECVAAILKPYACDMSRTMQNAQILRQSQGTVPEEYAVLLRVLFDLLYELPATEVERDQKRFYLHDWLSFIDADRGEGHVPVETLKYLRGLRKGFLEQNRPTFVAAIDDLIRKFEGRGLGDK